jgi:hypothetical protein
MDALYKVYNIAQQEEQCWISREFSTVLSECRNMFIQRRFLGLLRSILSSRSDGDMGLLCLLKCNFDGKISM